MLKLICPKFCPAPFCEAVCPPHAITVENEKGVYLDMELCHHCGLCRMACTDLSQDKNLQKKRPWISAKEV